MDISNEKHSPSITTVPGKNKRRWRSGTVAGREVAKLSKTTHPIIPLTPFNRLVHEIANDIRHDVNFKKEAIEVLKEAAEQMISTLFVKGNISRIHSKRQTLHIDDLNFAKYMTDDMRLLSHAHDKYTSQVVDVAGDIADEISTALEDADDVNDQDDCVETLE